MDLKSYRNHIFAPSWWTAIISLISHLCCSLGRRHGEILRVSRVVLQMFFLSALGQVRLTSTINEGRFRADAKERTTKLQRTTTEAALRLERNLLASSKGFSAPSPPHSPIVPFTTHFLLLCDPAIGPPCTYLTPHYVTSPHPCFIHRCCIHLYTLNACLSPLYAICILCSAHYLLPHYSHHTIVIIIFSFF